MSIRQEHAFKPHVLPALSGLARIFFREHEAESLLHAVAHLAVEAGPPAAAGAWLHVADPPCRLTGTDAVAEAAAGAELDLGEGPCLSAWKEGRATRLDSVGSSSDRRWRRWTAVIGPKGLGSTLAVPLVAGEETVGGVGLHAPLPLAFDEQDVAGLEVFGALSGAVIANFQTFLRAKRLGEQLTEALATRDLIGTAKGILMEREAIDEDAAFALLRGASQRSNRKLREIAHVLVRSEKRPR